jgi:hypothetical protein
MLSPVGPPPVRGMLILSIKSTVLDLQLFLLLTLVYSDEDDDEDEEDDS